MVCFSRAGLLRHAGRVPEPDARSLVPNRPSHCCCPRRRYLAPLDGCSTEAQTAQTAWPFRRCSSPGPPAPQVPQAFEGLRPLAYPCLPSTPTTGSDGGWWTAQWAQDLQGLGFPEGANVPMYLPHQGHTSPPVDPSPKVRSPMSPKYPGILVPPPLLPPPGPCLLSCTRHAMYGLSLAGPGEPYWGPQDRPPPGPGRRDGRRGYIETSPPQSRSVRLTLLALISKHHQPSPTTATNTPHLDHPDQP